MTKQGLMSLETRTAIDKILHPDTRGNAPGGGQEPGLPGWNVSKNDNDKDTTPSPLAGRHARGRLLHSGGTRSTRPIRR